MRASLRFGWKLADPRSAGFGLAKLLLVAVISVTHPLALADGRQELGPQIQHPSGCCGIEPTSREIAFYVLNPGVILFLGTNSGSPMLLQIEVMGTRQSAEVFINCGEFLFNGALNSGKRGIAYKELREWGGCRLAVANVSSRSSEVKIGISLVGQDALMPTELRPSPSDRSSSAQSARSPMDGLLEVQMKPRAATPSPPSYPRCEFVHDRCSIASRSSSSHDESRKIHQGRNE